MQNDHFLHNSKSFHFPNIRFFYAASFAYNIIGNFLQFCLRVTFGKWSFLALF